MSTVRKPDWRIPAHRRRSNCARCHASPNPGEQKTVHGGDDSPERSGLYQASQSVMLTSTRSQSSTGKPWALWGGAVCSKKGGTDLADQLAKRCALVRFRRISELRRRTIFSPMLSPQSAAKHGRSSTTPVVKTTENRRSIAIQASAENAPLSATEMRHFATIQPA
jgi:hypothetical protein